MAEAIAWTAEPVSHADEEAGALLEALSRPARINPITAALKVGRQGQRGRIAIEVPRHQHEHAFSIGHLFMAMRFAFFHDNETLPIELRTIADPVTGKIVQVKTHERAERILGRRYSFSEQWRAFERLQKRKVEKLAPGASSKQRSEAYQVDFDFKREALALRELPEWQAPRETYAGMHAIREGLRRAFVAR